MRARALTLAGLAAIAVAVAVSLWSEERFVVENAHLEREGDAVRVVGTVHNAGDAPASLLVDISVVSAEGRLGEKETVQVPRIAAGERIRFTSKLHRGDLRAYTIHVNEGQNPYGN